MKWQHSRVGLPKSAAPGNPYPARTKACGKQGGRSRLFHARWYRYGIDGVDSVGALVLRVATALLVLFCVGCGQARLDENLCPRDGQPPRNTLLLLDTSDPLSAKHRAELQRLVKELQSQTAELRVAPGEALIVYELGADLDALAPVLKVCNPGVHPDQWEWWQELTRGRAIDLQRWRRFREAVEGLFDQIETETAQSSSPLIETLSVILPRHAPSAREAASSAGGHTHLILFSDLLQHSDALSHYGPYPAGDAVRETPGLRALQTDLTGIDVSLLRLERSRDARWQTRDHYYWWTHLVRSFGGRVVWQQSI